jgi:leader peptidase (prepilin peptidase)/N-methyltransferase
MPPVEVVEAFAGTATAYVFAFAMGAVFGSFANVCILRLPPTAEHPRGRSIVHPGSQCGTCGAVVRWYDNLPVLSFLWLRGRCRACRASFSPRYLLVEVATGLLFIALFHAVVAVTYVDDPIALRLGRWAVYSFTSFVLVVIAFIDLDHKLILDRVTYPAIPAAYLLGLTLPERAWTDGLWGAAVGYGLVRIISDGYYALTKREGLGYGDGKLLAIIGALLGWQAVIVTLFGGSLVGSVVGISAVAIARRRSAPIDDGRGDPSPGENNDRGAATTSAPPLRHVEVPFGPFLVVAALAYLFVEEWIQVPFHVLWGLGGVT